MTAELNSGQNSRWATNLAVLLLAAFFGIAFYSVVYLQFQKFRTRIADRTDPDVNGNILLDFHATPEERNTFQTLILRLTNQSDGQKSILVQLNAGFIQAIELPARTSKKFNLHLVEKSNWRKHNKLKLKAESTEGWRLDRAEIANYYGASKGIIDLLILNKESAYRAPGLVWAGGVFVCLLLAGLFLTEKRNLTFLPRLYFVLLFLIVAVLFSALLLPLVSKYRLVFSLHTFLLFLASSCFPLLPALLSSTATEQARDRRLFFASLGVIAILAFYLSSMLHSLDVYGDYSSFLRLSEKAVRRNPFLRERKDLRERLVTYESGYDGMFMYFITYDPLLSRFSGNEREYAKFIDFTPYRYARIGFPLLTKLFSLNKPDLYPQTMVLLIVFSHLIGAFFLVKLLLHYQVHPLWSLLYLSVPAFCVSLENALPESIACAFLLAGVYFYVVNRVNASSICLAGSILVRETGAVFLIVLIVLEAVRRNRGRFLQLSAALIPYALWKIFLGTRLADEYGVRAFTGGGDVFNLPLTGLIQLWSAILHGTFARDASGAIFFSILILFIFILSFITLRQTKNPITITFFCYASLAICLNYRKVWLFVPNAERATYEVFMFLVLAFVSTRDRQTSRLSIAFLILFGLIFIYDLFFLSVSSSFRGGFSLLFG